MTAWKHVFDIFFVVFDIIILTTSASLRAVDPLFGCLTVKLIITFEGSVLLQTDATAGGHLPFPTSARSNDTGDAEHGPGC
jgi:hypothetical protein